MIHSSLLHSTPHLSPAGKPARLTYFASRLRCAVLACAASATVTGTSVASASPTVELDLETGLAAASYNDVAIPGESGTRISLTDDLDADPALYYRFQTAIRLGERHAVRALYAPLTLGASGALQREVVFVDSTFPIGTFVQARYQFNSYRLTYRYSLWLDELNEVAVGLTGKIRDARVSLVGGGQAEEFTNVGFVPLLHLLARWQPTPGWGLLLEADAAAAPQGRAEDVLVALELHPSQLASFRLGYRMVEGGADNDKVYTFTWIHYAAVGATVRF